MLRDRLVPLGALAGSTDLWRSGLQALVDLQESLWPLTALAHCHCSAHTDDAEARKVLGRAEELIGRLHQLWTRVEAVLGPADDATLDALCTGELEPWRHQLEHLRDGQALALEPKLQALLVEVDREALHGWGQLYTQLTGKLSVRFEHQGQVQDTSIGQLSALLSDADPTHRRRAHRALNSAFSEVEDTCASILTHITGSRQTRCDRAGIDELAHTLHRNRIDREVLDAMWEGSAKLKPVLTRYLSLKSRALGHDGTIEWADLRAPLGTAPGGATLSWADAQKLIVDAFRPFEPQLADFSVKLLREGGVEAEDRPHKRQGGYCIGVSTIRSSRIFLTYTGSVSNAVVLAHELGHAWHNDVLYGVPSGRRHITSGLAESASTYAESILRDQLLSTATDPAVKLFMLDQKLQAGVGFLMNIDARFRFERDLYRMRREGPLSAQQLSLSMQGAQREAYGPVLATTDPLFWASKLHFYISHFGFYNWPYTFGYLFSSAIYQRAVAEGASFRPVLRDLLLRTGWQDCRSLARDTLGADLADPAFWEQAARPLESSLAQFESLLDS